MKIATLMKSGSQWCLTFLDHTNALGRDVFVMYRTKANAVRNAKAYGYAVIDARNYAQR